MTTSMIGIDLGTTNSAVAVWRDGAPHLVSCASGDALTPSVVALDHDQIVVGRTARELAEIHPERAVYSIKRLMGHRLNDAGLQDDLSKTHVLYDIHESQHRQGIEVSLGHRHLTPQQVSALILNKLKLDAERALGRPVSQAVITVPAYFHDSQRQATRDAGRIAGLEVKRVLNEPTAACLAFAYHRLAEARRTVAVFDLGGGTFDVSILDIGRGPFRVRATNGDTHLGGDDFDWAIVEWMLRNAPEPRRIDLQRDRSALSRLLAAAQRAKTALSSADTTLINVSALGVPGWSFKDLELELTRPQLNLLTSHLVERTIEICGRALADAKIARGAIDEILMVGGQTRMPQIRSTVAEFFGKEPNVSINPDEVVALGAAVQAAILTGQAIGLRLADATPLSLGVNSKGAMDVIIPRNTPTPTGDVCRIYTTAADRQEAVQIEVYQGENPLVRNNLKLGVLLLRGIESAAAGEPEIEVGFRVDQDGILNVTARNARTGAASEITVTDSLRLTDEEIHAHILEAEGLARTQMFPPTPPHPEVEDGNQKEE
jgi:molecular chaperone DnaK